MTVRIECIIMNSVTNLEMLGCCKVVHDVSFLSKGDFSYFSGCLLELCAWIKSWGIWPIRQWGILPWNRSVHIDRIGLVANETLDIAKKD